MEKSKVMMMLAAALTFGLVVMVPQADAKRWLTGSNGSSGLSFTGGWTTNVNYTRWVQGKHFYNGDWLFFVYDRDKMNVLEVNKTDYESCNSDHPLRNWTMGAGRDVVPLNETRDYYFISGKGFCHKGMKLAIRIENPPLPPAASPSNQKTVSLPPAENPTPPPTAASPLNEMSGSRPPTPILVESPTPPPTAASPLNEMSGSRPPTPILVESPTPPPTAASPPPSSVYRGQIVLPVVLAIGALWDAFVRVW